MGYNGPPIELKRGQSLFDFHFGEARPAQVTGVCPLCAYDVKFGSTIIRGDNVYHLHCIALYGKIFKKLPPIKQHANKD